MRQLDVSVIIPFKNHPEMTIDCLKSLEAIALKEILLVNNGSNEATMQQIEAYCTNTKNIKLLRYDKKFNYQKINNWAVKQATGKVLWLLNNDVEIVASDIVEAMYNTALEKNIGATGCTLLYGDKKTIQHAGVYLVPGQTADHLYIRQNFADLTSSDSLPYDFRNNLPLCAVTAASLMVEKKKFDKIHGFNEDFIITGGDVDLCLRLNDAGYQATLVGYEHGYMLHKESQSRSHLGIPYVDFAESYKSYIKHFASEHGDGFVDVRILKETGYL